MKFLAIILLSAAMLTTGCNAEEQQAKPRSFLIVDLDGDGFDTISLEQSSVLFDIDGDGFAERTEWIQSKDAFIQTFTREEDFSLSSIYDRYMALMTNADQKLVEFDLNADGIYDHSDFMQLPNGKKFQQVSVNVARNSNLNGIVETKRQKHVPCDLLSLDIPKRGSVGTLTCENNKSYKVKNIVFDYEDTNEKWISFCNHSKKSRDDESVSYREKYCK